MPLINATQLIGKTFYVTKPIDVYTVESINTKGDNAKKIGRINTGNFFILDSFLMPAVAHTSYGYKYATRTDIYFLFYDSSNKYLAVKYVADGRFSLKKLAEQGVKTVEQEIKEKEAAEQTPVDKITDTIKNLFTGVGNTLKTVIYIGVGVLAVGYLLPKILKK